MMRPNTESDFWLRVQRGSDGECWPWLGSTNEFGQGMFIYRDRSDTAHRVSWLLAFGEPPARKQITRSCGNVLCVNPKHLLIRGGPEHKRMLFIANIDKQPNGGCWLWTAARQREGYGICRQGLAHRISWKLHRGAIPRGLCVCHSCDNPPCVNPDHLFLGTHTDNMRDMVAKNRHYIGGAPKGHTGAGRKVPPEMVGYIRSAYAGGGVLMKDLAVLAGVDPSVISRIVNHRCYAQEDASTLADRPT